MFFLRKSTLERLPVAMSGVKMGERALQIGVDDASLIGAIAAKVGLSGHAAIAVTDERQGGRARAAAAAAGAFIDVHIAALESLPFERDTFDVVVLHARGVSHPLDDPASVPMLCDVLRVLRAHGRIVIIESGAHGLLDRVRPAHRPDVSGTLGMLATAGFRAARLLAEREGDRFFEAVK